MIPINVAFIGTQPSRFAMFSTSSTDLFFSLAIAAVDAQGNLISMSELFHDIQGAIKKYTNDAVPDWEGSFSGGEITQELVTFEGITYNYITVYIPAEEKPSYQSGVGELIAIYEGGIKRPLNLGPYINQKGVINV
jgi:hypothetical protein